MIEIVHFDNIIDQKMSSDNQVISSALLIISYIAIIHIYDQKSRMEKQNSEPKILSVFYLSYIIKCKIIKKWRKLAKKSKGRYLKLREWSDTEEQYLNRLNVMKNQIKAPMIAAELITEYEETILFPSLDSMIQLGELMKINIDKLIQTWDPINTEVAPTVTQLANGLKIYKDYTRNYEKADKQMQKLKQLPSFNSIVKVPFIEDYLIKPVQRPLQYKLFIVDYLKFMPKHHKDRKKLQDALQIILKIADEINQFVDEGLRAQQMCKLENIFHDIIRSTRRYISSFCANVFEVHCKIYVCNDILLIAKQQKNYKEHPLMKIPLSHGSYLIRRPSNKFIPDSLYICGTYNSTHLTFDSKFDLENAEELLKRTIQLQSQTQVSKAERIKQAQAKMETMFMNRYSKNSGKFRWKQQHEYHMNFMISVVGSCRRIVFGGKKIFFFVKIQLNAPGDIYQIGVYELEELRKIEQYLEYLSKKDANIESINTKCKAIPQEYGTSDYTKYHEYKSLIIQNFLNSILRSPQICKGPEFLLYKLRIHEGLWDYLNKFDNKKCLCQVCMAASEYKNIECFFKAKKQIQSSKYHFCIMNSFRIQKDIAENMKQKQFITLGYEEKLLWADCKENRIIYELLPGEIGTGKIIEFQVTLNFGYEIENFPIQETSNCCVRNIIKQICSIRNLGEGRDLILCIETEKDEYFLDNDENIQELHKQLNENTSSSNVLSRISFRGSIFNSNVQKDPSQSSKNGIILRKIYTFNKAMEQKLCKQSIERYQILLGEFIYRLRTRKIFLSVTDIKYICAYLYLIEEFNILSFSKTISFNQQILKHYLPKEKWNFISQQFIHECTEILIQEVKNVKDITTVYQKVHTIIDKSIGWRHLLFPIKCLDTVYMNRPNLYLGVGASSLILYCQNTNVQLNSFRYGTFSWKSSGDMGWIITEESTVQFININMMTIETMINRYKLIHEFSIGSTLYDKNE